MVVVRNILSESQVMYQLTRSVSFEVARLTWSRDEFEWFAFMIGDDSANGA